MKIIFDNEKQKEKFTAILHRWACPHEIPGLSDQIDCHQFNGGVNCKKCWEMAVDMEVKNV